ncbi:MAG: hypothetical protein HY902_19125 [Deltaproteobacteria bacterium]|nr:hypothetical protein [Deltaproteobacteria bacterium]
MSETPLNVADLPPVHELGLDAGELAQWLADLQAHARVHSVAVKGGPGYAHLSAAEDLADAGAALQSGACAAVQVRYHFDGFDWVDTVNRLPAGARLVRMRVPEPPVAAD